MIEKIKVVSGSCQRQSFRLLPAVARKVNLFLHLIIISSVLFYSFDWDIINKETMARKFDEMNKQFKSMQVYSISVAHTSFEDYIGTIPHEKSTGYFKKEKINYHSFLLGIHTIQNSRCKVVVDSTREIIVVADPDHSFENTLTQADYTALLSVCNSIKKSQIGKETQYRLEFAKENPLNAYEFALDQKGLLSKLTVYYNREIKRENNTVTKPRMEITLSDWKKNINYNKEEFDESKYVFKKEGQYFLQSPYAGKYKLLDQRVVTKEKK
jgi:hypothetical protein